MLHLNFPSSPTSFVVSVDPVVYLSVLDHYTRRSSDQVVGALLGVRSEDGMEVEIRNCFPLPYSATAQEEGDDESEEQQLVVSY